MRENGELRSQLAHATAELDTLRERVNGYLKPCEVPENERAHHAELEAVRNQLNVAQQLQASKAGFKSETAAANTERARIPPGISCNVKYRHSSLKVEREISNSLRP